MRHVVIVCLLFLMGATGLILPTDSSIRITGGLGELATKTLTAQGVEVKQDGVFTIVSTEQEEALIRALCGAYQNLGHERDIAKHNLANLKTTKTENGTPYRRQQPVFGDDGSFQGVVESQSTFNWVYEPSHPDAFSEGHRAGYVCMPNVNPLTESQTLERVARERELLRTIVHRLDPKLIFSEEPLGLTTRLQTASKLESAVEELNGAKSQNPALQHFNLQLLPEPFPDTYLRKFCLKQSNRVSCGQTSVAVALNYLSGSNLNDQDVDEHYGFCLLEALKTESPPGIEWRDAGNLTEETWPAIAECLKAQRLPVIVAFAGEADPTDRGYIVTLLAMEGDLVTYADPLTGGLKTMTKHTLLSAPSHPDGNFIFLPSRVPIEKEINPYAVMNKPMGPSGLL